jgi:hypothetical protein
MTNIKLIIIGHSDRIINFDAIKKHKSKFFNFSDIERINNLPNPQKDDVYLNQIDILELKLRYQTMDKI